MGLRKRLKRWAKRWTDRFSGEYSAAAPKEEVPYERNLGKDPDRVVTRARLVRPDAPE